MNGHQEHSFRGSFGTMGLRRYAHGLLRSKDSGGEGHGAVVTCCCEVKPTCAEPPPTMVSGSIDKTLIVWDCQVCVKLCVMPGHDKKIWSCCALSQLAQLASASSDGTLKIWQLSWNRSDKPLDKVDEQEMRAHELGRASGRELKEAQSSVKCAPTQKLQLVGHRGEVKSCIALNNDKWILSGSPQDCCRLWSVESGDLIHTYPLQAQWAGIQHMPHYGDVATPCSCFVLTRSTFQDACFILDLSAGENRMPYQSEVWQCYVQPDRRAKVLNETSKLLKDWPKMVLLEPDVRHGNRTLIHRAVEEDDVELLGCLLESYPGVSRFCGKIEVPQTTHKSEGTSHKKKLTVEEHTVRERLKSKSEIARNRAKNKHLESVRPLPGAI